MPTDLSAPISTSLRTRLDAYTPTRSSRGAIISTTGREGTGKSGFAITALPTGKGIYIGMDRKPVGDYIESQLEERRVFVPKTNFRRLEAEKKFDKGAAEKMWDELYNITRDALCDKGIRAIVWDTGNHGWEVLRMARFGKLVQVMPHHYGPVNTEFESLMWLAEENAKIFVLTHKMSKEYKTNKEGKETWTGAYERSGYSHMNFVCNIVLEHFRTKPDEEIEEPGGRFGVRVIQNKIRPTTDGIELVGDDCAFPFLAAATWPDGFNDEEWM